MYAITYDKPGWDPEMELEYDVMPRDEFGVPAHIPPELSTTIRHTYYVPPQYYPFFEKVGRRHSSFEAILGQADEWADDIRRL